MRLENADGVVALVEAATEDRHDDRPVGHFRERVHVRIFVTSARFHDGPNGGLDAVEPALRLPHREDDLGVGERRRQLPPVARAGPIDLGAVAVEHLVPIDGLSVRGRFPVREERGVLAHLEHVMARPEAELLEGELQGIGARAAEAGTYDLESHRTP